MTEVRFYHLQARTQDQVLPALLSKAYEQGKRIVVRMRDEKDVEALNAHLWTFNPNSFLPHGSVKTSKSDTESMQPIWLTYKDENPNNADVLIITHGASSEMHGDFPLCCEMFDGHDEQAVADARERWKAYKEQGFEVTYWQQNERGGWAKL
ncbi:MAG: DNA polymerase III subunit chi [Alphaproteobacteria bacterium]|nr:DNA polymerase III subunit chi [Alphaproteobacteria bacterium]